MWTILKERKKLPGLNQEYDKEYLQREDGFTLFTDGMGRDKEQIFVCKGSFGEFRFYATRWNIQQEKALDKYIVYTTLCPRNWPLDREENAKMILSHAKDIESGLLHFPISRYFDNQTVKEVWFSLDKENGQSYLILAEEIQV